MRRYLILFALMTSGIANADVAGIEATETKIDRSEQKNVEPFHVSEKILGFGLGASQTTTGAFRGALSLREEYFIGSEVALGMAGYYSGIGDFEQYGAGPTASYYFWHNNLFRSFVSQEAQYVHYSGAGLSHKALGEHDNLLGRSYVGAGWFVLDLVAGYSYPVGSSKEVSPTAFAGLRISVFTK